MSARPTTRVVTRLLFVVAIALAVLAPATAAFADNYPPTTPTTVKVKATSESDPATLPFTGGDAALLAVIGVGVLGGGVLLVWMSRRRSRSAA